jgi:hypothetical protein
VMTKRAFDTRRQSAAQAILMSCDTLCLCPGTRHCQPDADQRRFLVSGIRFSGSLTHMFDPNQLQPAAETHLLIVGPALRTTTAAIAAATTSARPTAWARSPAGRMIALVRSQPGPQASVQFRGHSARASTKFFRPRTGFHGTNMGPKIGQKSPKCLPHVVLNVIAHPSASLHRASIRGGTLDAQRSPPEHAALHLRRLAGFEQRRVGRP